LEIAAREHPNEETAASVWQAIPSSQGAFPDMIREPHHRVLGIEIFRLVQRLPIWTPDLGPARHVGDWDGANTLSTARAS